MSIRNLLSKYHLHHEPVSNEALQKGIKEEIWVSLSNLLEIRNLASMYMENDVGQ